MCDTTCEFLDLIPTREGGLPLGTAESDETMFLVGRPPPVPMMRVAWNHGDGVAIETCGVESYGTVTWEPEACSEGTLSPPHSGPLIIFEYGKKAEVFPR